MKILIATEKPFAASAVTQIRDIIENAGHELLLLEKYTQKQQFLDAVKAADAVIVRSDIVDKAVFDAAPNLKIVVRAGSGYDNVDVATATNKGVCVMNTPGQNSNAVAELTFGLLLNVIRSGFDGTIGSELRGKKLGLHAFGAIGKIVAGIANGFGLNVYAYSPSLALNPERGKEYNVTAVSTPEELYEKCDIVSLHMPKTAKTIGAVNFELLSRLPQNGVVINTARKEVINENDMLRIMTERPKFRYATDIKMSNDEEMTEKFGHRYLSASKKCGAQTAEANLNAGLAAATQIVKFFADGDETHRVNPR